MGTARTTVPQWSCVFEIFVPGRGGKYVRCRDITEMLPLILRID